MSRSRTTCAYGSMAPRAARHVSRQPLKIDARERPNTGPGAFFSWAWNGDVSPAIMAHRPLRTVRPGSVVPDTGTVEGSGVWIRGTFVRRRSVRLDDETAPPVSRPSARLHLPNPSGPWSSLRVLFTLVEAIPSWRLSASGQPILQPVPGRICHGRAGATSVPPWGPRHSGAEGWRRLRTSAGPDDGRSRLPGTVGSNGSRT